MIFLLIKPFSELSFPLWKNLHFVSTLIYSDFCFVSSFDVQFDFSSAGDEASSDTAVREHGLSAASVPHCRDLGSRERP